MKSHNRLSLSSTPHDCNVDLYLCLVIGLLLMEITALQSNARIGGKLASDSGSVDDEPYLLARCPTSLINLCWSWQICGFMLCSKDPKRQKMGGFQLLLLGVRGLDIEVGSYKQTMFSSFSGSL